MTPFGRRIFYASLLLTITGTLLLAGRAVIEANTAAAPTPLPVLPVRQPTPARHQESYIYVRGERVKVTGDERPIQEDPVIGPEWQRFHNVILPCGHRWAYCTWGTYSSRRDVCEQGHNFVYQEGVWVPKPPDPEPGPAAGAWPGLPGNQSR